MQLIYQVTLNKLRERDVKLVFLEGTACLGKTTFLASLKSHYHLLSEKSGLASLIPLDGAHPHSNIHVISTDYFDAFNHVETRFIGDKNINTSIAKIYHSQLDSYQLLSVKALLPSLEYGSLIVIDRGTLSDFYYPAMFSYFENVKIPRAPHKMSDEEKETLWASMYEHGRNISCQIPPPTTVAVSFFDAAMRRYMEVLGAECIIFVSSAYGVVKKRMQKRGNEFDVQLMQRYGVDYVKMQYAMYHAMYHSHDYLLHLYDIGDQLITVEMLCNLM